MAAVCSVIFWHVGAGPRRRGSELGPGKMVKMGFLKVERESGKWCMARRNLLVSRSSAVLGRASAIAVGGCKKYHRVGAELRHHDHGLGATKKSKMYFKDVKRVDEN